jgi:8-oxo-dGTP pyrophosphatase MutT (NUDIX family)
VQDEFKDESENENKMAESVSNLTPVSLAGAIIEHPELGLLLQLRDGDAPTFPHHWGLFGGHMEEGESPEVAIWRELEEELALTPDLVSAWRLGQEFPHASGGHVYIYYITTHATLDDLVLGEGEAMHYAKISDLNPPLPYLGHPFTTLSAVALETYLATVHNARG